MRVFYLVNVLYEVDVIVEFEGLMMKKIEIKGKLI